MKQLLLALLLLVPSIGWAQVNTNTMPPMCIAGTLLTTCVPQVQGTIARINDADDATVCVNAFGGSTTVTCQFDGSSWFPIPAGGTYLGASGDTVTNAVDGTFMFTNTGGQNVTITCADATADCDLTLTNGGAGTVTIGTGSNATPRVDILTNLVLVTASGTLDSVIRGADLSGAANTRLDTTGAGQVILGSDDVTAIVAETDVTIDPVETATFGAPNEMTADRTVLNQYIGIPKLNVTHTGAFANGTTNVAVAAPLKATCSAIVNGAEADDTTNFITTISSYKYTWAADVAEDDGIDCVIGGRATTDPISLGFWFRTDTVIASGDIDINFDDGGVTDGTHSTFATTVLDEWHWIELDITTACAGECADLDGIEFLATAQADAATTLDGAVMNIDQIAIWLAADETAIGDIQVGGLIDLSYAPTAAGSANTQTQGVEWTHYFINYQTGADAVIPITNLSTEYGTTLEALN